MKKLIRENKIYQMGLTAFLVIAASIVFFFLISKIGLIWHILGLIINLFTPFIIGFVFAYLLNPIVKFFNKQFFKKLCKIKNDKLSNYLGITVTCILFIGIIVLLFSFIIPELLKSIEALATNLPTYILDAKNYLLDKMKSNNEISDFIVNNYNSINDYVTEYVNSNLLPKVDVWLATLSSGVFGAVKVVFNIFIGFVMSIYYLADKEGFISGTKRILYSLFPVKIANNILDNTRHTNQIFGNFLIGKMLDGFTIGFITFLFLTIFGYPYALLIGVIIGITNMIPYFGPYIGTIPSALLILIDSPAKCLVFVIFIIVLQQVDSYLIEPKLCGSKTGLKSFWVLASILFFGSVFGIIGMILGVPIFALIFGYLDNKITLRLKRRELPIKTKDYVSLERINSENLKCVKQK